MTRHRVLDICHNHPELYVGGAEVCAWELFQAMREFGPAYSIEDSVNAHGSIYRALIGKARAEEGGS